MQLYKANKASSGGAISLRWDARLSQDKKRNEGYKTGNFCFWVSMVAQSEYNEQSRTGKFRGDKITAKLSPTEAGAILYCLENYCGLSQCGAYKEDTFYHKSADNVTTLKFSYTESEKYPPSFSFAAKQGESKVFVPISLGEARLLRTFFETGLKHIHDGEAQMNESNFKLSTKDNTPKTSESTSAPAKKAVAKKASRRAAPVVVTTNDDEEVGATVDDEENPF